MKRMISVVAVIVLIWATVPASAQTCAWRPWAWYDSNVRWQNCAPPILTNGGPCELPNWDYSFSQTTLINMAKDTPPGGGAYSFHFFWDQLASSGNLVSHRWGSGGIYQEITVQPGIPLRYSFAWKGKWVFTNISSGAHDPGPNTWFEFLLIDGPFTTNNANDRPDNASGNNPYIMRKITSSTTWDVPRTFEFPWTSATHQDPPDMGPAGERPQTLTPNLSVVTVVLKAGCTPLFADEGVEAFFDAVDVWQDNEDGSRGPNLVVGGDFEDEQNQPLAGCGNESMSKDATRNNYWIAVVDQCPNQHTTSSIDPAVGYNDADTTVTITGTNLENVDGAKLVPVNGGTEIVANTFTPPPGPDATSLTVTFPTTGKLDGTYNVVTTRGTTLACQQTLFGAFTLLCPGGHVVSISGVSPASVTDPGSSVPLTLSGTNVTALTSIRLEYVYGSPPASIVNAAYVAPSGDDLIAGFDLHCVPAGTYRLVASASGCQEVKVDNAVQLIKSPPLNTCLWHPWASNWSVLNTGTAVDPAYPNVYNPTNWDYSLSQDTLLGTPKDTPDSSAHALHWFLDVKPIIPPPDPPQTSNGAGSGGVYQEITVQPGVALQYSYDWKYAAGSNSAWFEFMLIDGAFNLGQADLEQETASHNNPSMIRKRTLSSNSSVPWEQVTDQTPADIGPAGPRPQTLIPTGNVVSVVLKAGRNPAGAMESFWDNIDVWQNNEDGSRGPNLIVNGDFESTVQATTCDNEYMFQKRCEMYYWMHSTIVLCPIPFADADWDGDVDQADFAIFQACYTGTGTFTLSQPCKCFDRPEPNYDEGDNDVDATDLLKFEACASGPGVPASPTCGD